MNRFLFFVTILIASTACSGSDDNSDTGIDMGVCPNYIACTEAADSPTAVLEATYGEDGECWETSSIELCQAQCEDALSLLIPTHPNPVLECFINLPECETFEGLDGDTTGAGPNVTWTDYVEESDGTYTVLELKIQVYGGVIQSGPITNNSFESTLKMGCASDTGAGCDKTLLPLDGSVTITDFEVAQGDAAWVMGSIDDAYFVNHSSSGYDPDDGFVCISAVMDQDENTDDTDTDPDNDAGMN